MECLKSTFSYAALIIVNNLTFKSYLYLHMVAATLAYMSYILLIVCNVMPNGLQTNIDAGPHWIVIYFAHVRLGFSIMQYI